MMMFQDSEIIISDTSCLILLNKIDELGILKLFSKRIYITPTIQKEFGKPLPSWFLIKPPNNKTFQKILELDLDAGEASALALALEFKTSITIIDDLKGRKTAEKLNLKYSGTFGLLIKAKQERYIKSIKPIIEKVKRTNFRFSNHLLEKVLELAGE